MAIMTIFNRLITHLHPRHHLRYRSLDSWAEGEGIEPGLAFVKNPMLFDQYCELKAHLWEQHFQTLSPEIQKAWEERRHPSQSHAFHVEADQYRQRLEEQLQHIQYVEDVTLGFYHGDQIILAVNLREPVDWRNWEKAIPRLYYGFQVKVGWRLPASKEAKFQGIRNCKRD